jgi:hypothetical protein
LPEWNSARRIKKRLVNRQQQKRPAPGQRVRQNEKEKHMKKWLPSLLPLLGTIATAALPQLQHVIGSFVSSHPAWASALTTVGLIVNHLITSPANGSSPTGTSSIAKAGTALMLCFALIALPLTTGCTQAQAVEAMQKVDTGLKIAKGILPQASLISQELQTADPAAAEYFAPLLQKAGPALDKLIAATDAYIANPGSDAYQAVLNGVDAFTAQVDQAALGTAGIKNPQSQAKVVAWIALFSTGLHVTLGILDSYATSKQKKAVPAVSARVTFDQIRPFVNRSYAHDELAQMGYSNPAQILAYAGL